MPRAGSVHKAWRPLATGLKTTFQTMLSPEKARARRVLGWLATGAIALVIFLQLDDIGWRRVWSERPQDWRFFALVLLGYLVLPVSDIFIFRKLWGIEFRQAIGAFFYKRVLNSAFVGYSGELFLLVWARTRVARDDSQVAHDIKDSNILSAAVSTYVSAALVLQVLSNGLWRKLASQAFEVGAGLTLAMAALLPVALLFRRRFLLLDLHSAGSVLGLHALRFVLVQALTLLQWRVALPDTTWTMLVNLLTLQLLVSRIPLLPNRDFLFVGVALALCGPLAMEPARLAGLLIVSNALQLGLHLVVLALASPLLRSSHGGAAR